MGFLTVISENTYLAIGLLCLVMIMGELTYSKNCLHYNTGESEAMREHILNKRYQLYLCENVDIVGINRKIARCHIVVIIASCLVMLANVIVGAILFLAGNLLASYLLICRIGESYNNQN